MYSLLTGKPALTAIVATRIYPGVLPQNVAYPAIAYRAINEQTAVIHESPGTNGQVASRFRFFSVAKTYKEMKIVDEALRVALTGFAGTVLGNQIQGVFLASLAADDYDDTTETYQFVRDFTVFAVR